jgi:dolichol-phosphate mannosyltransferase
MMKIVIVVPTYNEKENITILVEELEKEFPQIPHKMHILVVDGNSPDGTAGVVRELSQKYPNVHLLLEKEKAGLGAAYIFGMQYAVKEMGAEVVVEMDADLQHNPQDVKRLVAEIDKGADIAVGTRYIAGGSIPKNWGPHRKFISFFGNIFARLMMGMVDCHDVSSGFRATRIKNFLEKVDLENLLSKRFGYKLDLYYRLHALGAKVAEVPIKFRERETGDSKQEFANISKNDFIDTLTVVSKIRLQKSGRLIKFAVVGVIGFLVQTLVFEILLRSRLPFLSLPFNATATAAECAVVSNFILSNFWTFHDRQLTVSQVPAKFLQFNLGSLGSIGAQWVTVRVGTAVFGSGFWPVHVSYIIGIGIGMISNYLVYSRIIWKSDANGRE